MPSPVARPLCTRCTAIVVLVAGVCAPAAAQRDEPAAPVVESIAIEGNERIGDGALREIMATRAAGLLPWSDQPRFNPEALKADLKRIVAFYHDRGYRHAAVRSTDVSRPPGEDGVRIVITVDEGAPTLVGRVEFVGFEALRDAGALRRAARLRAGEPLDVAAVRATTQLALDALREEGYAHARVGAEFKAAGPGGEVVSIVATPGDRAVFGPVDIAGLDRVDERIVRDQLAYRPGELFRASGLRDTQRQLERLELFRFVSISNVSSQPSAEIATRVTVVEGNRRRVTFSGGYGSEEHLRGEVDWRHLNFFGGARRASAEARYSSLTRGVRLRLQQPRLARTRASGEVAASWWLEDEPAYVMKSYGGRATLARTFDSRRVRGRTPVARTLSVTYTHEYARYTVSEEARSDPSMRDELLSLGLNPDTGEGQGLLSSLSATFRRSTTDTPADPRRGTVLDARVESAGRWLGGDFTFVETSLAGFLYRDVAPRAVLALRARASAFAGPEPLDQHVPFFKRYFLGGSTGLRGWGRFEVGPPSSSGTTLGGIAELETSAELRIRVWRRLGVVGFVDAGNAWDREWLFRVDDLRIDTGTGLRYRTPVGQVRFDIAAQLTPIDGLTIDGEPETRRWRIHVSIGQAF